MCKTSSLFIIFCLFASVGYSQTQNNYNVSTVSEIRQLLPQLKPGNSVYLNAGTYKNIKLNITVSGKKGSPIHIKAKTPGTVFFTGDVKIEIRGEHIILEGIYFKNGQRNFKEWKSHGPGLIAIYGSFNRITQCAFHAFDEANSAYITTSLKKDGTVPQFCRIDHCSFTDKTTYDQVINLNNTLKKSKIGAPGIPMYHRIDHCFFSNPKKPGNSGGGIRVGYWRKDFGRCLIDSNLFYRQDSEAEIVTSKSRENVYYNNTFLNCQGTLNFRHGDKQIAIHNFFIGNDTKFGYGGMFVWGSEHLIASNYFELSRTIKSRGNAALYLNSGVVDNEHSLVFNTTIANNIFANTNGYAIDFNGLDTRRIAYAKENGLKFEIPRELTLKNNLFYNAKNSEIKHTLFREKYGLKNCIWNENSYNNKDLGIQKNKGLQYHKMNLKRNLEGYIKMPYNFNLLKLNVLNIEGIPLDISKLASQEIQGSPLTFESTGPTWLKENPSTYSKTGKKDKKSASRLKRLKH